MAISRPCFYFFHFDMPHSFESNIRNIYGNDGEKWLAKLPSITKAICLKHAITHLKPVANLSYNFVAEGHMLDKRIILKVSLNQEGLINEAKVLNYYKEFGAVKLLYQSTSYLLLEKLEPAITLKSLYADYEKQSLAIFARIIKKLWQCQNEPDLTLPTLKSCLSILDKPFDIPKPLLEKARKYRDLLLNSTHKNIVLHGDLHHDNILQDKNEWKIIDSQGLIGDSLYELSAFILNPFPALIEHPTADKILEYRINYLAQELKVCRRRIMQWVFVKNILCWAWSLEDNLCQKYNQELSLFLVNF